MLDRFQADVASVQDAEPQGLVGGELVQQVKVGRALDEVQAEAVEGKIEEAVQPGGVPKPGVQHSLYVQSLGEAVHHLAEECPVLFVPDNGRLVDLEKGHTLAFQDKGLLPQGVGEFRGEVSQVTVVVGAGELG